MNLETYLQTLSKEDMISLISELVDRQENVRQFLNAKISDSIKEVAQENDSVDGEQKLQITSDLKISVTLAKVPHKKKSIYINLFSLEEMMCLLSAGIMQKLKKADILQSAGISGLVANAI